MLKISIPKPCHEDWDKMTAREQGRHCDVCAKTVVDFTNMSDEQVQNYFISKQGQNLCGRFRNEQLDRITIQLPADIFYMPMPLWKKFLVACLLAYSATLFSCDANTTGKAMVNTTSSEQAVLQLATRNNYNSGMVGMFFTKTVPDKPLPPVCTSTVGVTVVENGMTKGDISIDPVPPPPIQPVEEPVLMGKPAFIDTPVVKMGEMVAVPPKKDTVKQKQPVKKDSGNCNNVDYY